MQLRKTMPLLVIALLVIASSAISAAAYVQDKVISGKYKGIAKSEAMGDLPITVDLKKAADGKLSGAIETAQGSAPITGGTIDEGTGAVKLTFDAGGTEGTVVATFKDGVITGKWDLGGMGGPLELKKEGGASAPAAGSTPPPTAGGGSAGAAFGGDFECTADVMGQAMPFTLKQEGDKITGESSSDQGTTPLANGKVAAGKLTFSLETPQGAIGFTSEMKEGKLVGKYDFAGQMTGDWSCKKK
jgi:opacity protein-like surface antigen